MHRPRLWHGAAYYPELWSEAVQREDLRLMTELGLNCVRMAEFAWSTMEPRSGEFRFAWLEAAMTRLHAAGISTILCTPTATPPRWILVEDPAIGSVDPSGRRFGHGGRQQACYTNPAYRAHSRRVTAAMAQALGRHPGLIAWQTDNEFRCHQQVCVCQACQAAWPRWLERRYGSIEVLNETWGTGLWSQTYGAFAEVPVLHPTPVHHHNYALETAYRNFMSDMVVEFQDEQLAEIRRHSHAPIGHNFTIIDNAEQFRRLDFVGADFYNRQPETEALLWDYDWMRALKPGVPFRVMETGADANGLDAHPDGYLAAKTFLTYTAGADLQSYWPWRQPRTGVELQHSCILRSCGAKRRSWDEVAKAEAIRRRLEPILQRYAPAPAELALVRSDRHGRFLLDDGMNRPTKAFSYWSAIQGWHGALLRTGAMRDVIYDSEGDPARYRAVFTPYLPAVSPAFLARMHAAVQAGCHWVIGPHCGHRTIENTVPTDAILGAMEDLLGFRTQRLEACSAASIRMADGTLADTEGYVAEFRVDADATVLGRYVDGPLAGGAWAIARQVGRGRIVVLGSELGSEQRDVLVRRLATEAGAAVAAMPAGVIVTPQVDAAGRRAWALANWMGAPATVVLPRPARDLLSGANLRETVMMPAFGCIFADFES